MQLKHTMMPICKQSVATPTLAATAVANRRVFFESLELLPPPIRGVVTSNYRKRVNRARGKPLLGECAPDILADLLAIKNEKAVQCVIPSWLSLYAYTLFIDDVLDREAAVEAAPLVLASQLLLQRGISHFYQSMNPPAHLLIQMDVYFLETAIAVMRELKRHKRQVHRFSRSEVRQIGNKVALLKLCAAQLLLADGQGERIDDRVMVPVELLATGMQLLDDITDWEEDWTTGSLSHLLTETFATLSAMGIQNAHESDTLNRAEVFAALVVTGSLEEALSTALTYLKEVALLRGEDNSSFVKDILNVIIQENVEFEREVTDVRLQCHEWMIMPQGPGKNWLSLLATHPTLRRHFSSLEKRLHVVAQSS